jgi:hypothetical protein
VALLLKAGTVGIIFIVISMKNSFNKQLIQLSLVDLLLLVMNMVCSFFSPFLSHIYLSLLQLIWMIAGK